MEFQMKLKRFLKQETVLSGAAVLAVLSMFFVPPDADYLGYIDLRTLAILFSLMTIMAGLRRQGVFDRMGRALLARTGSTLQLVLVLVGLCFFGSMIITNDVSLLTFVPFTFVVLSGLAPDTRRALTIPVVCMQTIAANLGSMLTPIGNPQNLYLYGKSGMSMAEFLLLMFPYTVVSLLLLVGWAVMVCRKRVDMGVKRIQTRGIAHIGGFGRLVVAAQRHGGAGGGFIGPAIALLYGDGAHLRGE
mgnify:CR=1 FL=1